MPNTLTEQDYRQAAQSLNTEVAVIKAVTEVESNGRGFLPDGRIVIRFEPHLFHRYTQGQFDATHPDISFPHLRKGYPTSTSHSWQLYDRAKVLNLKAARMATSFGLFQVLGSNWPDTGSKSLAEFITRMSKSENEQLNLFCHLITAWGLDDELRNHKWAFFAKVYNGPGFKLMKYDDKLADAYKKHSN
ncbi:N-acetylmuramidase family protein [Spirosoma taeanense]|uniref:N-acetylmuramidase family protein n=1 Tax=Spirosoma taeanense TaxID=2735870 RepID=A0A6M5YEP7_9BACT|nr:N-acetylmuramidase family protein [Spirosoma taeanense]QJW91753.1 N-acetylmuramidase family protein [Spirosoma taeanense]